MSVDLTSEQRIAVLSTITVHVPSYAMELNGSLGVHGQLCTRALRVLGLV